jgi:hypothetical protein
VTEGPDYLAAALHFAVRGRRFLNDSERPSEFEKFVTEDTEKLAKVIKFANIKPE